MRNLYVTITICIQGILFTACGDDFMAKPETSERELNLVSGNVDSAGNVSGSLSAGAAQVLSATSGDAAGTSVSFPAGSLAISTTVTISGGETLATSGLSSDLGISGISSGGGSVAIMSSTTTELATPAIFSIPSTATGLVSVSKDLWIVLYRTINKDGTFNLGLIPNQDLTIESGKIKFQSKLFGVFQAAIAPTRITEAKKVQSFVPPVPKSSSSNPLVGEWASTCRADNRGDPSTSSSNYRADVIRFSETTFIYVETVFTNSSCTGDYYERENVTGSYTVGDAYGEGSKFNVTFTSRSRIFGTDAAVSHANANSLCGFNNWVKGTAKSLQNNCDPDPQHSGPAVGDTWYSIYKIQESAGVKYFRMGDDQGTNNGRSEATRPTTLESTEKAMKRQ